MDINKEVIFDYVSATLPERLIGNQREQDKAYELRNVFKNFFKLHDCQIKELDYATNNFKYEFVFSDFITLRCGGPYNDSGFRTCQLELKGEGCREFERLRPDLKWKDFFYFLIGLDARFKRIDTTIDDKSGKEIKMEDVFNKIKNGYYTSIFRSKPKYFGTLGDGLTINLGTRQSQVELCIYDKLHQQQSLNKKCEYEYWTRYEMRFRQAKADSVVLDLLDNYQDDEDKVYGINLKAFATKALYAMLDIKEKLRDDKAHLCREATDSKWLKFLETSEKGILPKAQARKSNSETSYNFIMPKAKIILLLWFVEAKCNKKLFEERLYHELFTLLSDTSRMQLKRFNQFMVERKLPTYTDESFNDLLKEISKIIEEGELPF